MGIENARRPRHRPGDDGDQDLEADRIAPEGRGQSLVLPQHPQKAAQRAVGDAPGDQSTASSRPKARIMASVRSPRRWTEAPSMPPAMTGTFSMVSRKSSPAPSVISAQ